MPTEEEIAEIVASGEPLLTPHDVAYILGQERDTVRRKMQTKQIEDAFKVNGQWFLTRRHFTEYLARGGKKKNEK
jgi:hypothetical protein